MIDQFRALPQQKRLGILCGLTIIAVLIATLWPFDFVSSNRVSWIPEANGIRFGGTGVVVSKASLKPRATESGDSCSLEVLVRPASIESVSVPPILSFYVAEKQRELFVGQHKDDLMVSLTFVEAQKNLTAPELDEYHVFEQGKVLLLTITSGTNGTVVYKNGSEPQVFSGFRIMQGDLTGQIVLGTSALDFKPWSGEIRGLAIYSKELTPTEVLRDYRDWTDGRAVDFAHLEGATAIYGFAEGAGREIHSAVVSGPDLEIPKRFVVPHKPFLVSPLEEFEATWNYVHNILVNIAGFVPLGFILCVYLACTRSRRQAILLTIPAGGMVSFVIEVLQVYIPQRGSGVTDIITNTLGAAFGALLVRPSMVGTILGRTKLITGSGSSVSPHN
ncbi:MAG: VanZ family protein [Acidobacteriia bacterium]|nr:VanZ family protein [Terriglobia bacterium]